MRLPSDDAAALRQIEDEAIATNRTGSRVNHVAAAAYRRDQLASLEAGGVRWAATVRDAAELDGHAKRIKARIKAQAAALPTATGGRTVIVPMAYSHRADDGSVQLTLWLDMPLDVLAGLIDDLERQAVTLSDRSLVMRYGRDLAVRHRVGTARQGFAAEGIDLEEAAA